MKRSKLILPLMAFICAIGMSFTTANSTILQSTGFVEIAEDDWLEVQVDCGTGDLECQVKFSENGEPYNVYESGVCKLNSV